MKTLKSSIILLFLTFSLSAAPSWFCSGNCTANCDLWTMSYTVDCNCSVQSYTAYFWKWRYGHLWLVDGHSDRPEFLGMDAGALGCDCPQPCN